MEEANVVENATDFDSSESAIKKVYSEISSACLKFNGVLEKINGLASPNDEGLSIIDVKTDLLLNYVIDLTYLVLKKSCGQSISQDEIREQLVHARVILERIKPLESKLKYYIDKLIKTAVVGHKSADKSEYRANVADLESNASGDDGDEDAANDEADSQETVKIYKPPKLASVPYVDARKEEKQRDLLEKAKKRALNSTVMRELKEEYLDTPLEVTNTNTLRNTRTKFREEKETYEETYFTRLPVTKKEKHRDRLMSSATIGTLGSEITRFEDLSALEGRLPNTKAKRKRGRSTKTKKIRGFKKRKTM